MANRYGRGFFSQPKIVVCRVLSCSVVVILPMCAIVLVKKPPVPQAGSIKTQSLIHTRSPEKCIKIAKTAGNKAFLAVFAVFVGVQFAPSEHSHGVPDADIWAPAQLAQGIIKMYAKIKWFGQN